MRKILLSRIFEQLCTETFRKEGREKIGLIFIVGDKKQNVYIFYKGFKSLCRKEGQNISRIDVASVLKPQISTSKCYPRCWGIEVEEEENEKQLGLKSNDDLCLSRESTFCKFQTEDFMDFPALISPDSCPYARTSFSRG